MLYNETVFDGFRGLGFYSSLRHKANQSALRAPPLVRGRAKGPVLVMGCRKRQETHKGAYPVWFPPTTPPPCQNRKRSRSTNEPRPPYFLLLSKSILCAKTFYFIYLIFPFVFLRNKVRCQDSDYNVMVPTVTDQYGNGKMCYG